MSDIKELSMKASGMSLRAYYSELAFVQISFRDQVMEICGISLRTFYERIKFGRWTEPEKTILSQHFDQPIQELFPEKEMLYV